MEKQTHTVDASPWMTDCYDTHLEGLTVLKLSVLAQCILYSILYSIVC